MSKTFMRGLALLEAIDRWGPITVTELARHLGIDKAIVSRMVTACQRDGWVIRHEGRIVLGPRASLLGHGGPMDQSVRQAEPLVHAIAGVTGLMTQAYGLVGTQAVAFASAKGPGPSLNPGLGTFTPLWVTAAGRSIAAQLDEATLDAILPSDPLPDTRDVIAGLGPEFVAYLSSTVDPDEDTHPALPRTHAELRRELEAIRRDGIASDPGQLSPQIACIAVPWHHAALPAALACVGPATDIARSRVLITTLLKAAVKRTATAHSITTAAAEIIAEPTS